MSLTYLSKADQKYHIASEAHDSNTKYEQYLLGISSPNDPFVNKEPFYFLKRYLKNCFNIILNNQAHQY